MLLIYWLNCMVCAHLVVLESFHDLHILALLLAQIWNGLHRMNFLMDWTCRFSWWLEIGLIPRTGSRFNYPISRLVVKVGLFTLANFLPLVLISFRDQFLITRIVVHVYQTISIDVNHFYDSFPLDRLITWQLIFVKALPCPVFLLEGQWAGLFAFASPSLIYFDHYLVFRNLFLKINHSTICFWLVISMNHVVKFQNVADFMSPAKILFASLSGIV